MFNLGHSIRTAVVALALTAIMTAGSHADALQPFEYTSQQDYKLPILMAAAQQDAGAGTPSADAEEPISEECLAFRAGCKPTLAQMSALMDNPLDNVAMLFTQFDTYRMENPTTGKEANKSVYTGILQFPKRLNEDWNLINLVVWTVPSMPLDQDKVDDFGSVPGGGFLPPSGSPPAPIDLFGGRTTGFGDLYYVGLFAPSTPETVLNGKLVWGVGFDMGFPTASKDILGTGKYTAGPSALVAYLGPKWKDGGLVQQYWDYAGDDDRDDVNLTNLQYLYYYSLSPTVSVGAAPNIICNCEL